MYNSTEGLLAGKEEDVNEDPVPLAYYHHNKRRRTSSWIIFSTALLLTSCLVVLLRVVMTYSSNATSSKAGLRDPQDMLPKIGFKQVVFGYDEVYLQRNDIGDQAWEDLMPIGQGYIHVESPREYDLQPGLPQEDPNIEVYGISVFHQIHCLAMLRHALHSFQDGATQSSQRATPAHLDHCLSYIRQALMCGGDTTIEWPRKVVHEANRITGKVDGHGITHQCRDWNAIREFAIERRATNVTGNFNVGA